MADLASPPTNTTPPPTRRTAFAEGVDTVRAAATTEPGRLRIIGALLALLVLAFGAVTAWQTTDREAAADDVLHKSQPLSSAAADIYRSLADANTAASNGFLAGARRRRRPGSATRRTSTRRPPNSSPRRATPIPVPPPPSSSPG